MSATSATSALGPSASAMARFFAGAEVFISAYTWSAPSTGRTRCATSSETRDQLTLSTICVPRAASASLDASSTPSTMRAGSGS